MPPVRVSSRQPASNPDEPSFDERVVHVNRVARVVKGGRRFRFQALVVVGDHKGQVGVGVAKGADVSAAVNKATGIAKKQLIKVPLHNQTLPHDAQSKVSGAQVMIMPAAPGTGLIAGGVVRTILEVSGVTNALSKSFGSSSRLNMAYATLSALSSLQPAKDWLNPPQTKKATKTKQANS